MTDRIDWDDFFYGFFRVVWIFAAATLSLALLMKIVAEGIDSSPVTVPATLRAADPKPPIQSRELPLGIHRLYLDDHLYYWHDMKSGTPILLHAAGCTNHAPCAQTVLQLEK